MGLFRKKAPQAPKAVTPEAPLPCRKPTLSMLHG
jgi:hypothetical protein